MVRGHAWPQQQQERQKENCRLVVGVAFGRRDPGCLSRRSRHEGWRNRMNEIIGDFFTAMGN